MKAIDDILHESFGLRQFRLMQREVITDILSGKDVLCVMPTGAGKSLCYQLPAVAMGGLVIVVSPLISLMQDQVRQLHERNLDAYFLNSTQSQDEQRDILTQIEEGFSGLLYVTPERFFSGGFQSLMPHMTVKLLAIDEAHCISQWGHDFRPEYSKLGEIRQTLKHPPTIAVTATATDDVRQDIIRLLHLDEPSVVVTGFDRTNLIYEARCLQKQSEKDQHLKDIIKEQGGTGIVYCSTRKCVDATAELLLRMFPQRLVVPYHAGMDTETRQLNQTQFMSTANSIAVATNAFGMGINKPDIRFVVHYDMPGSMEQYYQEAGRGGRDGELAKCVLLYHFVDRKTQEFFISRMGSENDNADPLVIDEMKQRATAKLDLMVRYARIARCRRQQILDYFGDESDVMNCTCDACTGRASGGGEELEMTNEIIMTTRMILSAVARIKGQFGMGAVAEVLGGVVNERAQRYQLDQLTVFGLLKQYDAKRLMSMMHRVIEAGLIRQRDPDGNRRPIIEITPQGIEVMKGTRQPPSILASLFPRQSSIALKSSGSSTKSTKTSETLAILDEAARGVFERLRSTRARIAREKQLPAYTICHDSTLMLIASNKPSDLEALEMIKGMGPHKIRMYGKQLLAAVTTKGNED